MIATPSAPDTIRATVFVADATPDLAAGTAPTTASVAGAMIQPIARVRPNNQPTSSQAPVFGVPERRHGQHDREAGEPCGDDSRGPEPADCLARGAGADHQPECHRAHHDARFDRAVAVRELEVLREREDPAEQGEEGHADRRRAHAEAGAAEEAEVEHRLRTRRSHQKNPPSRARLAESEPEHGPGRPALLRRLDDRVDEDAEAGRGERGAEQVERARARIAALGDVADAEQQGGDCEGDVDEEDRRPVEPLEQQPAGQRPEADADRRERRPDADRLAALLAGEDGWR